MTDSNHGDDISAWTNDIHQGDALEVLAEMPESSVHAVVTSPPYFGLRDYGVDGQIGLEDSLEAYIDRLVEVGAAIRRVLRDDGNWWLNLGDSFQNKPTGSQPDGKWSRPSRDESQARHERGETGLDRKQKMLVPHRVAIALQDAGWWVRGDCVWAKPNGMPQSVKDRFTEKKEFVFHLTPAADYYFDLDAVREPYAESTRDRMGKGYTNVKEHGTKRSGTDSPGNHQNGGIHAPNQGFDDLLNENGKNPGDWWEIPVQPFPEAHFAVYPPKLVERPIKASCPEGGIVLDPFAGAGTTCLVAKRLGRQFIGIDLNPDYVALAQSRVGIDVDEPDRLLEEGETSLAQFTDGGGE